MRWIESSSEPPTVCEGIGLGARRAARGWLPWLGLALVLAHSGACTRVEQERVETAEQQRARAAIASYSVAAQDVNGLHAEVISGFQRANRAASLVEYRDAIKREVLPSMDRFVDRLRAMPTGTPELSSIHAALLAAYVDAREELAVFADSLQTAADLQRFGPIRERLQRRIAAYRGDLDAYYRLHRHVLKLDGPAVGAASGATATTTP